MNALRLVLRNERGEPRLTAALVERLIDALATGDAARIVTLEGDAGAFCEGMDLDALSAADVDIEAVLGRFAILLDTLESVARPVVALVDGPALGGGAGLAAAADLVIASPRATFALPECIFGVIPAMVIPVLARRIGHARARWMAMGAAPLTADEALHIGLADEIRDEPESALARYTRRLERLDAEAVAAVKPLAALTADAQAYREAAGRRFRELLSRAETHERIARFRAGDTPWPDRDAP